MDINLPDNVIRFIMNTLKGLDINISFLTRANISLTTILGQQTVKAVEKWRFSTWIFSRFDYLDGHCHHDVENSVKFVTVNIH